ncbi:hypothetical protein CTZ24_04360 [Pantoea phytobeneficialis]|uniref:Uncharacterized protein n=1 Tax=Pantoea phytobeneficialis TaxID=2052056 RepID=A0AAP9KN94_9GAMM|nr:hypothetical protein CTZ24_04360 [Pantoea phytobeneficialis]
MAFKEIKSKAISCLKNGCYDHEARCDIDTKNLFSVGEIDEEYVISLIQRTFGDQYTYSPHHQDSHTYVHLCRPYKDGCYWYVKFYFIEPDIIFISVHR